MKITDIQTTILTYQFPQPMRFALMTMPKRSVILVRILTDEGIVGIGEAEGAVTGDPLVAKIIETRFKPMLVGQDPLFIAKHWRDMFDFIGAKMGRKGLEVYAISGLDIALWDILGKVAGQPIYKLLGAYRDAVPAYGSLSYHEPAQLPRVLPPLLAKGFRAFKLRIGVDLAQDEDVLRVARETVGPDVDLMVDVNSGWPKHDATKRARKLEKYVPYWYEEPLQVYDLDGYADIAAAIDTPIALGEHHHTRYDFKDILLRKAGDIVQPDIRTGGISEAKKIADLASAFDVPCIPHVYGSAIKYAASMHVICSSHNSLFLELDVNDNPLRTELASWKPEMVGGKVRAPDGPGLGIELDEKVVAKLSEAE